MAAEQAGTPISPTDSFRLQQDAKRASDHRHKYTFGSRTNGSRVQPASVRHSRTHGFPDSYSDKMHAQAHATGKAAGKHPQRYAFLDEPLTSDSSAPEDDLGAPSAAPEPDADIAYSYDRPTGPSRGNDILSMAINKAVERYETKATEKLVRDEYDVVNDTDAATHAAGYVADDDDFELV